MGKPRKYMKKNMGTADRLVRFALAAAITTLFATNFVGGTIGMVLLLLAAVFYIAGLSGYCPLFGLFGISSVVRKTNFVGKD